MNDKEAFAEERTKQLTKEIVENLSPIIAKYVGYRVGSDLIENKIAEILNDFEKRISNLERILADDK